MSVIQISKIQLRRGNEADFSPTSLDVGEFGFALDTGRLFIGAANMDPWKTRTTEPPYGNIEVLTEASLKTFSRLFDRFDRSIGPVGISETGKTFGRHAFYDADLPQAAVATSVRYKLISDTTGDYDGLTTDDFIIAQTTSAGAFITYSVLMVNPQNPTGSKIVVRTGTLTINHDGNTFSPNAQVLDEFVAWPQVPANGSPMLVDQVINTDLQFTVAVQADGPAYNMVLQYTNTTGADLSVQFRVSVIADLLP